MRKTGAHQWNKNTGLFFELFVNSLFDSKKAYKAIQSGFATSQIIIPLE
jgi:hypothetical protein